MAATILVLTFLSFSVAALVIETRFASLKPEEISPTKQLNFGEQTHNFLNKKQGKRNKKQKIQTKQSKSMPAPTEYLANVSK